MKITWKAILGSAIALSLMGQGCAMNQQAQIEADATSSEGQVDASVDTMLRAEDEANTEEREGDTDAAGLEATTEIDSYSQTQYEIK